MSHEIKFNTSTRRALASLCAGALLVVPFAVAVAQQHPAGNDARVVSGLDTEKLAKNCADAKAVIPRGMVYSIPMFDWQTDAGTISVELAVADTKADAERLRYPEIAQMAAQPIHGLGESGKTGLVINGEIVSFRQRNVALMLRGLPPPQLVAVAKKIDASIVAGTDGVALANTLPPILIEIPVKSVGVGEKARVPITIREGDRLVADFNIRFTTSEGFYARRDPQNPNRVICFWDQHRPVRDPKAILRVYVALLNGRFVTKEFPVEIQAEK